MAEQTGRQEQKQGEEKKPPERPQIRKVRFQSGVFLGQALEELDLEGRWAQANKARVELHPGRGMVVRHIRTSGPKTEEMATWVPEWMIKQADCAPEWKP